MGKPNGWFWVTEHEKTYDIFTTRYIQNAGAQIKRDASQKWHVAYKLSPQIAL